MILLIVKSYLSVFLAVGLGSFVIFILGLYLIFKDSSAPAQSINDFTAISGDDVIATQLDLARAFIETNNKKSAKKILKVVLQQGSKSQKDEAKILLGLI